MEEGTFYLPFTVIRLVRCKSGGKVLYVTRRGAVVVDRAGKVITDYSSKYYDDNMKRVVARLFGR